MAGAEPSPAGNRRRVLLVDDDEAVLRSVGEYLSRAGYEVIRAATGRGAITAFEVHRPDATILDLKLPDVDGLQVLAVLRPKNAMVIMLTGNSDMPTAVRAMQLGAENFLTKPVDLPHLVATIEHGIEKLDLRRENVRLRRAVPSPRRHIVRALVLVLGIAAALALGRWIGAAANVAGSVPEIAPVHSAPPQSRR